MKCKHYNGDGYEYIVDDELTIYLCESCNMNLASEILKQLALEVFIPKLKGEKK
jgi:hypothetical protein